MKKFYILLITLFLMNRAIGQSCLPQGITFTTQAAIDNFQTNYPNCTQIDGDVAISGGNSIVNLLGLCDLMSIGGSLTISDNVVLYDLSGLNSLTVIGGSLCIVAGTYCNNNQSLTSLSGLNSLTTIGGSLTIGGNYFLNDLSGLNSLISVGGDLTFFTTCWLPLVGYQLVGNPSLTSLTGLDNLNSIGGSFSICQSKLKNLSGLNSLTSIGGDVSIGGVDLFGGFHSDNPELKDLTGLNSLTSIGGFLRIFGNDSLASLTGLVGLTSIGERLWICYNNILISLTGLENIDAGTILGLSIYYNDSLSNCEVESICDYLISPNGTIIIVDNATGCNNQAEVEAACALISVNDLTNDISFSIYPNPAFTTITIETPIKGSLSIQNLSGQQIHQQEITESTTTIDVSGFKSGVYFVRLTGEKKVQAGKFVKL